MTIAYIRTYSNKQQTESQKNAIEQFAKAKKIEIDKWLKDAKNSSKEKNRLEDVIKNLQEGDILIVADVTRLSRKLMEIMHLILLCIEKKVALYCIKEGYSFEDNVNSKTLAFTFGLVSEIESKLISARTKEALTASKNKGTKLGRPLGSPKTEFLLSQKSQIERELKEENATYAELADYYKVSLSGFKQEGKRKTIPNKYKKRDFQIYLKIISIMFNKIVEFLFCADIIKTPKVFCLTFGVHYMTYFLLSNKSYPIYYLFISASIASNSGPMFRL